jgi:hypothetical protein
MIQFLASLRRPNDNTGQQATKFLNDILPSGGRFEEEREFLFGIISQYTTSLENRRAEHSIGRNPNSFHASSSQSASEAATAAADATQESRNTPNG